jgi:ATP-binding cassette subfamily B protein
MIKEICKDTNLNHVVSSLPKGYDTILDEKVTLSAGEKQLLTIARAMIQNAPMMILDEATSNTDTRTEIIIQNAMDKLTKGRTSFVIAHRLSTIKNADLILVMDHGDIVEQGNHKTLLKKKGFYANLYNSQFSEE